MAAERSVKIMDMVIVLTAFRMVGFRGQAGKSLPTAGHYTQRGDSTPNPDRCIAADWCMPTSSGGEDLDQEDNSPLLS